MRYTSDEGRGGRREGKRKKKGGERKEERKRWRKRDSDIGVLDHAKTSWS